MTYRLYLTQQRKGLFSDSYFEYDSFYFPSLTMEEVNKLIAEANEAGIREDQRRWIWKMKEQNTAEVSRRFEIIHNETDCLMPPEIWVKHHLFKNGYNIS